MKSWRIPSSSGDYQVESDPENPDRSILTVEDPSDKELEELGRFRVGCSERSWNWTSLVPEGAPAVDADEDGFIYAVGRTRLRINAPLTACGPLLVVSKMPDRTTLTAIASSRGQVVAVVTAEKSESPAQQEKALVKAAEKGDKAVTTRRGTVCCPEPIEGPLKRASRVMREWCTPSQWKTWVDHAFVDCYGGVTGRKYRVYHRHHPHAVFLTQPILDLDMAAEVLGRGQQPHLLRRCKLHRWDYTVPPAEEVLGAKLILEHREAWIRNASGTNGELHDELLPNPVGDRVRDGTWDAGFFRSFMMGFSAGLELS